MRRRFFIVPDFWKLEEKTYEKQLEEAFLMDVLGSIDASLLENDFIDNDMECDKNGLLAFFYRDKMKEKIGKKLEVPVIAVKRNVRRLLKTVSGIAAALLLLGACAAWVAKKTA